MGSGSEMWNCDPYITINVGGEMLCQPDTYKFPIKGMHDQHHLSPQSVISNHNPLFTQLRNFNSSGGEI